MKTATAVLIAALAAAGQASASEERRFSYAPVNEEAQHRTQDIHLVIRQGLLGGVRVLYLYRSRGGHYDVYVGGRSAHEAGAGLDDEVVLTCRGAGRELVTSPSGAGRGGEFDVDSRSQRDVVVAGSGVLVSAKVRGRRSDELSFALRLRPEAARLIDLLAPALHLAR